MYEERIFSLTVDYSRSLQEMIKDSDHDWVNPGVTADLFPVQGSGVVMVRARLVYFNIAATTLEVLEDIRGRSCRSAKIEHILALAKLYPDEQRKYPIIALDSAQECPRGGRNVPALREYSGRRALCVYWDIKRWKKSCRFLEIL